jgi:membrane protease YdiL (CAAX protease family)
LLYVVFFYLLQQNSINLYWQVLATLIAILITVYLGRRFIDRRSFISLGWRQPRRALPDMLAGIAITGVMMAFIYFIELRMGWLSFSGFAWKMNQFSQAIGNLVLLFIVYVLVGFQEELFFRGYVMQNIADGLNMVWAVVISSLNFSLFHFANPGYSWMAFIGLLLSGVFIALGYVYTRQLWLPFGIHLGWNFFEGAIFGFQVSGLEGMPRLIVQTVSGPTLMTGGSFGPEAGMVLLPALLVGTLLIYLYTRLIPQK